MTRIFEIRTRDDVKHLRRIRRAYGHYQVAHDSKGRTIIAGKDRVAVIRDTAPLVLLRQAIGSDTNSIHARRSIASALWFIKTGETGRFEG